MDLADVTVAGTPLSKAFEVAWNGSPSGPVGVRPLLLELYDAVESLEAQTPRDSLVARDAADRIHEITVSTVWMLFLRQNQNSSAMDYCLWILALCREWERNGAANSRYIHKGGPYFFGGIAALRARNIEVAIILFESGDLADSDTFARAGVSEAGQHFPGRDFLRFDPHPYNLLQNDVLSMRATFQSWLDEFEAQSGGPAGDPLLMADEDELVFRDPSLTTESRFMLGFLLRTLLIEGEVILHEVKGRGPLSRRQQAEWALGLLTATEGIMRRVEGTLGPKEEYFRVVARIVSKRLPGASLTGEQISGRLGAVAGKFSGVTHDCLDYWRSWTPAVEPVGFPWFVRWIEPGRFIRNKTAHLLATPPELDSEWLEVEKVARFALLAAIWLLRERFRQTHPRPAVGVVGSPSGTV